MKYNLINKNKEINLNDFENHNMNMDNLNICCLIRKCLICKRTKNKYIQYIDNIILCDNEDCHIFEFDNKWSSHKCCDSNEFCEEDC